MKIDLLSPEAQAGLHRWACDEDRVWFYSTEARDWAWLWFHLREADDRPKWFPKGKWATLQVIEHYLIDEAKQSLAVTER